MSDSTKDRVEGSARELKGSIKEKAGEITGNPNLQNEGADEKLDGKIQRKVGEIKKVLGS